jgi:hypothetical protein
MAATGSGAAEFGQRVFGARVRDQFMEPCSAQLLQVAMLARLSA